MCNALAQLGQQVTLFAKRSIADEKALLPALKRNYGVELPNVRVISFFGGKGRGDNLRIAMLALGHLLRKEPPVLVISRNLYASFMLGVLRSWPLIFETHQLELGVRKWLQRAIMSRPHILTLVISRRLVTALQRHHNILPARCLVLHDAAPRGIEPLPNETRNMLRAQWETVVGQPLPERICGYFGHLYSGRGIEVIEAMAHSRPEVAFLVFGGTEVDIAKRRATNTLRNVHFMGYLHHAEARRAMATMNVLLMPYQGKVSIGVKGHDTADWMSPMKMFEYMSVRVPIIASHLPVLEEVLEDGVNCLLAAPDDPKEWISCLDCLLGNPHLATALTGRAYADYRKEFNWVTRATRMLEAVNK